MHLQLIFLNTCSLMLKVQKSVKFINGSTLISLPILLPEAAEGELIFITGVSLAH